MKKLHPLLTCIAAAALSLTLILSLAACGQCPADTGDSPLRLQSSSNRNLP